MANHIYDDLINRLKSVYQRERLRLAASGLSKCLLLVFTLSVVVAALESVGRFGSAGRFTLLALLVMTSVFGLLWFFLLPLVREKFNPDNAAKKIGEAFPHLKDRLLNAMQVYREQRENPFTVRALERVAEETKRENFVSSIDFTGVKKIGGAAASSMVLAAALFAFSPTGLGDALHRVVNFNKDFTPPAPFRVVSLSKNVETAKGADAEVKFRIDIIDGSPTLDVRRISLKLADANGFEVQNITLTKDSTGVFAYRLRNQKQELSYFGEAEAFGKKIRSETHTIKILDKPRLERFQLTLTPPAYSRLSPQQLEPNFGDASALVGTRVSIRLKSSKPLQSAQLRSGDSLSFSMDVQNDVATVNFQLRSDLTYRFEMIDKDGYRSSENAEYHLRAVRDEPPRVKFLQPETTESKLPESLLQSLATEIQDDYGFNRLVLNYKVTKSEFGNPDKEFQELTMPMAADGETDKTVLYTWDLNKQGVVAGDELEFYAEVFDNDAVSGYKSARTDIYKLRLPTLDEVFAEVDKSEQKTLDALEKKLDEAKAIEEQLEKVQNDLRQKNRADWQDKKALESALQKQQELQQSAQTLSDEMQKMMQEMQERNLVSEETLEKYQEIQRLLEQLNSPELKEAMKQLQEAMQKMSEQQLREALKNMQFNEEQMKQSLERTKELLKRVQVERKLDEAQKRMADMIEKQERLKNETVQQTPDNKEKLDQLRKEQQSIEKAQKEFQQSREELEEKMKEYPKQEQMPLDEMEKLKEQQMQDKLEDDLKQAQENLARQKPQEAAEKQRSALQKMRQQQKQLADMKQEISRQRKQEMLEAMQNAAQSALELSMEQEALKKETEEVRGQLSMEQSREAASKQQQILESLRQLQESISKIGKKSSQMRQEMSRELAKAEQEMEQAVGQLENRQSQGAAMDMQSAMQSLNEFAKQTGQLMADMMGQQQGGDGRGDGDAMSELMQGLTGQQGELNGQTEGMMQGTQADKAQRLAQMAAQQRLIQQQLQQLSQKQKASGKNELLGNLDKIAEEMEEAAKQLEQQNLSRELVKRQQQILSRMLESTRSLKKQEQDEQRQATAAKNLFKKSPAELKEEVQRNKVQDAVNRMKQQGFSDDYQRLIRKYYEALEKMQKN